MTQGGKKKSNDRHLDHKNSKVTAQLIFDT